jgi:hypothetical protein
MKVSTVREFRDNATSLLRSKDPILVTRRGRLAGVFFPSPEASLPIELKRELFSVLSEEVGRQIKKRGLSEAKVVADFESWRKDRREARRRR